MTTIVLIFGLTAIPSIAQAAEKAGSKCAKEGTVSNSSGTKYRCANTSNGLTWIKSGTLVQQPQTSSHAASKSPQIISVPHMKTVEITAGKILGFSASSKLQIALQTGTPLVCTVQDTFVLPLQTGTCSVVVSQPGNDKYSPAQRVSLTIEIVPPKITSDNALFDEVQTFIRVSKGTTYSSDTAEITLTSIPSDATAKVCADKASALGCTSINGSGAADPASDTRYVEFAFRVKNLDANPLPTISYRLLLNGVLSDIDSRVGLESLNDLVVGSSESADGSFFAIVPKNLNLNGAYLVIDEGITDSSIRLLFDLSH